MESGFEYEPSDVDTVNPRDELFERELAKLFGVHEMKVLHTRLRSTPNTDAFVNRSRARGVRYTRGYTA